MATIKQTSIKISTELGQKERELKNKLQSFYNSRIKNSPMSLEQIKLKYGAQVENIIGQYVQDSWLFSNQIMQERIGDGSLLTGKDGQGIQSTTNKMIDSFWQTAFKLKNRETEYKLSNNLELVQLAPLSTAAAMGAASAYFLYYTFNLAMMSKADELGLRIKLRFTVRDDCVDNIICLPLNGHMYDIGNVPYQPPLHKHCHCKLIPVLA